MEIRLNGKAYPLAAATPLPELLAALGLAGRPVLVEWNHAALLASEHAATLVRPNDELEIIQIVAGG
jgi:thiamine biosynthesis protein ThiS